MQEPRRAGWDSATTRLDDRGRKKYRKNYSALRKFHRPCNRLKNESVRMDAHIGECSKTIVAGELAEWLMAPVLKTGIPGRVSGVRIPHSPPLRSGPTRRHG